MFVIQTVDCVNDEAEVCCTAALEESTARYMMMAVAEQWVEKIKAADANVSIRYDQQEKHIHVYVDDMLAFAVNMFAVNNLMTMQYLVPLK